MKRIGAVIAATSKELAVGKVFKSRDLVLNVTTGEMRQGPGAWKDMALFRSESKADVTVDAATTGNVTIATALNVGDVVGGVTLTLGMKVLVKDQSTPNQNGIYVAGPTPERHADFDTWNDHPGTAVKVTGSTIMHVCTAERGGTLGTTAITWQPTVEAAAELTDLVTLLDSDGHNKQVSLTTLKTLMSA